MAAKAVKSFTDLGGYKGCVTNTLKEMQIELQNIKQKNMTFLIKGSRNAHMEQLVQNLLTNRN